MTTERSNSRETRVRMGILLTLQAIMAAELVALVLQESWASGAWLLVIMAVTGTPALLGHRLPVRIPAEFEMLAILFVFASLFLGEFRSFYERYLWWDIALHGVSGLLLGIVGFLLVYVLNESSRIDLQMRAGFVALFAFVFAVAVGALWEIFEFTADQCFGTQMQKPMLGDPSGLTDTMWDLIVDALGAGVISAFGWWHIKRSRRSFIEVWADRFIESNPRLFECIRVTEGGVKPYGTASTSMRRMTAVEVMSDSCPPRGAGKSNVVASFDMGSGGSFQASSDSGTRWSRRPSCGHPRSFRGATA